jgi:hypothetical protein
VKHVLMLEVSNAWTVHRQKIILRERLESP